MGQAPAFAWRSGRRNWNGSSPARPADSTAVTAAGEIAALGGAALVPFHFLRPDPQSAPATRPI